MHENQDHESFWTVKMKCCFRWKGVVRLLLKTCAQKDTCQTFVITTYSHSLIAGTSQSPPQHSQSDQDTDQVTLRDVFCLILPQFPDKNPQYRPIFGASALTLSCWTCAGFKIEASYILHYYDYYYSLQTQGDSYLKDSLDRFTQKLSLLQSLQWSNLQLYTAQSLSGLLAQMG